MNLKNIEKNLYYNKIAKDYILNYQEKCVIEYIKTQTHLTSFDLNLFNKHLKAIKKGYY